jgi:ribosomal protein L18
VSFASRALAGMGAAFRRRAGALLEPIVTALSSGVDPADKITGTDAGPFSNVFHLDRTDHPAWLGQATGTPVPGGLSLEAQREYVRERPNARRGTPGAVRAVVRSTLRGSRRVQLVERDGTPDHVRVQVYNSEVTDLTATTAAAMSQKPVGLLLAVEVLSGATYAHMTTAHGPSYADFTARFPTYADARDHVPE